MLEIQDRRQIKATDIHKLKSKDNPEKANNAKHSKTKLPWFVVCYDTWTGNQVSLFYTLPSPHVFGMTQP